jgi:pimeloyl-ACP methyl ester carboxylesterase
VADVDAVAAPARDVDRSPVAWREAGAGPATLLLLHGLGGSRCSWEPQLVALAPLARVAAWDLPGYGASEPAAGPLTFPSLAQAVLGWADTLGAKRFHLAGLSFGGMIAQYVAAAAPARVASLTLMATSPCFGLDGTSPAAWRAARLAPLDAGEEPAEMAPRVLGAIAGPGLTRAALGEQVAAMARIPAVGLRAAVDCLVTHDSRAVLPAVTAPTVVLVGDQDTETPPSYAAALAALVPGARVQVVGGAGHLLNAEAPDVVNAALAHQLATAVTGPEGDRTP